MSRPCKADRRESCVFCLFKIIRGRELAVHACIQTGGKKMTMTIEAAVLTERFEQALVYMTHVHGGHTRKGTSVPYISHLMAVAATVLEYGGDEDLAIAGFFTTASRTKAGANRLHDVRNRFGDVSQHCRGLLGQPRQRRWRAEKRLAHTQRKYLADLPKKGQDFSACQQPISCIMRERFTGMR